MDILNEAKKNFDYMVRIRRHMHEYPENSGVEYETVKYIASELDALGIEYVVVPEGGIIGQIHGGKPGKTVLLRADMDALPMPEESGEPFACPTGKEAHACGHDFHAAMLLTAAKMLKENESELEGTVKFMFQPAEETFEGGKNMIENGILENPKVDAYHVAAGQMRVGIYMYNDNGTMMYSVDGFRITINGKGSHGAYPQKSIDPINVAVHVYLALEAIMAREVDPTKACVMTVGKFEAGTAANIIPDTAVLEGTIRSNDNEARQLMVRRMKETAQKTAECFGASADITMLSEVPPLICDPKLTDEIVGYMKEIGIPNLTPYPEVSSSASEDFASIAEKVPATFMYLSAGYTDERGQYGAHNPKVQFNEDVCPIGSSCLAYCATQWLKNNK